jgi:integrase
MSASRDPKDLRSILAPQMNAFVAEKQAAGYRYKTTAVYLRDLDRFLVQGDHNIMGLPKGIVEEWVAKRPNEGDHTHFNRVCLVRQFAMYLCRQDLPAYAPPHGTGKMDHYGFTPRIFTHAEIQQMFHEVDNWPRFAHLPLRHVIMPELFRTLYACGLRVGEALALRVGDVDLQEGILTIRHAKFDKDRLVPLAPSLLARLRAYAARLGPRDPEAYFFPGTDGRPIHHNAVYTAFREILWKLRIPHVGRGQGPRVHDLRHTFAVHRLLEWYRQGADLNAKLPLLCTYLGHRGIRGTQRYLHMIPELLTEITGRLEESFGHVVPGGTQ